MRGLTPFLPLLALAGCGKIGDLSALGLDQFMPKVAFKKVKVTDLDFQQIQTDFVFAVENPNPIKVKLSSFSYDLDLAGVGLMDGTQADGLTLEAQGDSKLVFPVRVVWKDLFTLVTDTKGKDALPFTFRGSIGFNTPLGELKVPFKDQGEFPVVHMPKFSFKGIRVGRLDLLKQTASVNLDLGIQHDGGKALNLDGFDYALTFGNKKVIEGLIDHLAEAPGGEVSTVSLPIQLNLLSLGVTIAEAITSKTKLDVGLDARLTVGTPFGAIPLSINEKGKVDVK